MYIKTLHLEAYRRFRDFDIDFDPSLTVIAARNGQGKTTVLEAIASALGPFVGAFDEGRGQHLLRTDVHRRVVGEWPANEPLYPVIVSSTLVAQDDNLIEWSRRLNSGKKGAKTTIREAAPLASWGKQLQEKVRSGEDVVLPAIAYYSSQRLSLSQKNHGLRNENILAKSRTAAYSDCLSASVSSFAQLELWLYRTTLAMLQSLSSEKQAEQFASLLRGIAVPVEVALREEGWSDLKYSFALGELSMSHADHGELPIGMLSDGVRAVTSLVADLALKCVRLNPGLGEQAPLMTPGIVLIDEVDLHLHPSWQQRIIKSLRDAFPNIQFILTTHSPQVFSTVRSEHIRIVSRIEDGHWEARLPDTEVKGLESSVALADIMDVDPIPDVHEARLVREYQELAEKGDQATNEGNQLRRDLEEVYGRSHQVLMDADRIARFRRLKDRISMKRDSGRESNHEAP